MHALVLFVVQCCAFLSALNVILCNAQLKYWVAGIPFRDKHMYPTLMTELMPHIVTTDKC